MHSFCWSLLLLLCTLLLWPAAPLSAGEANVFVYHRFGDGRYPSTNIDLQTFAEQLSHLDEQGYRLLTLGEIVRRIQVGEPLPDRSAALTVDDAYATFLTGAMPLLRRYGYPATLFVSTDLVGRPGYLDWNQLRQLKREGVEIGNHSASHGYLLDRRRDETKAEWLKRVRDDLVRAQRKMEQELDEAPRLFAYPYGEFAPDLVDLVRELGFSAAAAQQSGVVTAESDLFALPRFPMGGEYATLDGFRRKLTMKALPVIVVSPESPIVGDPNPPEMVVEIPASGIDQGRLRCFVSGQGEGKVVPDPDVPGRYRVRAEAPLSGRRSKYTLTAPGEGGWYWFSQLWVMPRGWGD